MSGAQMCDVGHSLVFVALTEWAGGRARRGSWERRERPTLSQVSGAWSPPTTLAGVRGPWAQARGGFSTSTQGPRPPLAIPATLRLRVNLRQTPTHLNPFMAKLLFNNYITAPTVLHNEISARDISASRE